MNVKNMLVVAVIIITMCLYFAYVIYEFHHHSGPDMYITPERPFSTSEAVQK